MKVKALIEGKHVKNVDSFSKRIASKTMFDFD